MRLELKEDPREWRKFTLFALLGLAILSSLLCWRRILPVPLWIAWLGLLALVAVTCLCRPRWFRGWYRRGATAGFHLAQFLGRAALFGVFWLLVTPLGLVLRLAGKDLLRLRRDRGASSYWQAARPPGPLDRMF